MKTDKENLVIIGIIVAWFIVISVVAYIFT